MASKRGPSKEGLLQLHLGNDRTFQCYFFLVDCALRYMREGDPYAFKLTPKCYVNRLEAQGAFEVCHSGEPPLRLSAARRSEASDWMNRIEEAVAESVLAAFRGFEEEDARARRAPGAAEQFCGFCLTRHGWQLPVFVVLHGSGLEVFSDSSASRELLFCVSVTPASSIHRLRRGVGLGFSVDGEEFLVRERSIVDEWLDALEQFQRGVPLAALRTADSSAPESQNDAMILLTFDDPKSGRKGFRVPFDRVEYETATVSTLRHRVQCQTRIPLNEIALSCGTSRMHPRSALLSSFLPTGGAFTVARGSSGQSRVSRQMSPLESAECVDSQGTFVMRSDVPDSTGGAGELDVAQILGSPGSPGARRSKSGSGVLLSRQSDSRSSIGSGKSDSALQSSGPDSVDLSQPEEDVPLPGRVDSDTIQRSVMEEIQRELEKVHEGASDGRQSFGSFLLRPAGGSEPGSLRGMPWGSSEDPEMASKLCEAEAALEALRRDKEELTAELEDLRTTMVQELAAKNSDIAKAVALCKRLHSELDSVRGELSRKKSSKDAYRIAASAGLNALKQKMEVLEKQKCELEDELKRGRNELATARKKNSDAFVSFAKDIEPFERNFVLLKSTFKSLYEHHILAVSDLAQLQNVAGAHGTRLANEFFEGARKLAQFYRVENKTSLENILKKREGAQRAEIAALTEAKQAALKQLRLKEVEVAELAERLQEADL